MKQTQRHAPPIAPNREGFTSLEFTVAIVVLGIALTGLFPLMVVSSRGIESLEMRYTAEGNKSGNWFSPVFRKDVTGSGIIPRQDYGTWYLVPSSDPWADKMGAAATFSRTPPAASSAPTVIDDGDAAHAANGSWATQTNAAAFLGDNQRHEALTLPDVETASWTFSKVATGYYYVLATWPAVADQATNATYVVYDGDDDPSPVTVAVNQAAPAGGSVYPGWTQLTRRYFRGGNKPIKVFLRSNNDKPVVADGVRIVPVSTILSINKSFNSEEVIVKVKIEP